MRLPRSPKNGSLAMTATITGVSMSKLDWLTQEIDGLKEQGLYNRIRTIGSAQGAWLTVDGKNVLNFCSNNYLGLANHPNIVEAANEATKKYGVGPAEIGRAS